MKKMTMTVISLLLVISVVLTGCGSQSATDSTKSTTSDSTAATTAASTDNSATKQDTLIVGRGGDSAALDPAIVTDGESIRIIHQVFEPLLVYKPGTTTVAPALATSWTVSKDGLTYVFKLRQGVKFHDGTDFNADAVVFNFNRWEDPKSPYKFKGDSFDYYDSMFGGEKNRTIKEVKALDANTVQFTLNNPQAPFLQNIAMPSFSIASPTAIKTEKENFKEHPVGTGPFVFKEWKHNDSITLVKNDNYWDKSLPKVNKLIIRSIPDNSARFTALQNGEIDLMDGVNPDDAKLIEQDAKLQKIIRPSFNVGYLGFNFKHKPFNDPLVRQALNMVVDKKALIHAFYGGLAVPAVNPMPPTLWGYNKDIQPYEFNIQKAKDLLAQAGHPNGFDQTFVLYAMPVPRPYMPDGKKISEYLQAQFAKIGVKVKIESPEWATYLGDAKKGDKDDMFLLGWTGDNGDPDNFIFTLLDQTSPNNWTFYKSEELHKILVQAQQVTDQAARTQLYEQAQVIIHKDAPWIPLVHSTPLLAAKANITGFVPSPTGSESYSTISFK